MTDQDDTPKASQDDKKAAPDAMGLINPMGFLMTDMQQMLLRGATDAPQRSEEDIEADFDNMPI